MSPCICSAGKRWKRFFLVRPKGHVPRCSIVIWCMVDLDKLLSIGYFFNFRLGSHVVEEIFQGENLCYGHADGEGSLIIQ